MYRIFGLNPQEYVNYNKFLSYVNQEDRDYVYNSTKEAFNGKIYATDYRIVRPDGEERIVHSEREVIFDEKNSSVRVRGTAQDVTEHEKAQEALRASEARYRSLCESSLDGILLTKPDGTILSANSQACSLFNMTEDEIIQAGRGGIVIKDERLAAMLEERKLTGKAMAELTFKRKDGSTFVGEISSSLFKDADGSIKTSIIRDITKRRGLRRHYAIVKPDSRPILKTVLLLPG